MTPAAPGSYRYFDPAGHRAQVVAVIESGGDLIVVFHGNADYDEGAEVLVADLAGYFELPL